MFTTERKRNTKSWWTLLWLSALITRTSRSNEVCNELVYLGGRFGTHRGSFSSPGYPSGTYPSREQCTWIVKVPLNYRVLLHFNDLDVESCPTAMKNCTCDYVSVADGQLLIDNLLAKVCGSTTPPDITSTGSFVRIDLVTDASNSRNFKGFSAQFYSVSADGATPTSFDGDAGMHHKTIPPLTDEPGKGGSSAVMIAIVSSLVGVVIIGLIIVFIYIKKKKQTHANQARSTQMPMSYPVYSASSQRTQQSLPPPPPYSSVAFNVAPTYSSTASIG